ncbi:MAG: hypothetical protein ACKV0T_16790 [Planctomycetales bacterium]
MDQLALDASSQSIAIGRRRLLTQFLPALTLLGGVSLLGGLTRLGRAECDAEAGADGCRCAQCGCTECILVPETKTVKKWIYCTKVVPYCLKNCRNPLRCRQELCDTCPECEATVRYKRVLIKREVSIKKPGFKCIPLCEACRAEAAKQQEPVKSAPPAPPAPAAPYEARRPGGETR